MAGRAQEPIPLHPKGGVHEHFQVDHVLPVVAEQQVQGALIPPLVALPQEHRHVAVHAVHRFRAVDAESGLDLLQPPPVPEAGHEKAQVHVGRGQVELGEVGLEHRQVELGAVEGDQEVELRQDRGKFLQIETLDELAHSVAVVEPHHRDQEARPNSAGGLDVQIADPGPAVVKEAPVLPGRQPLSEIGGVFQVRNRLLELPLKPTEALPGQAPEPLGGEKILPGDHPLPPEMRLEAGPHPGEVNESAL